MHIIRNNRPEYVVLTEARYQEMLAEVNEAYLARAKESLKDYKDGRVKHGSADELIKELGLDT